MSHSFGLAESLTLNYIYMARHHHHEIHGTTALAEWKVRLFVSLDVDIRHSDKRNLNPQLNCINWINTIVIPNPNSGFSLRPRSAAIGMIDRRRGLVTTVRQILVTDVPNSQDSNYPTFRLKKDRRKAACNVMLQIRIRDTVVET
ncbi:hypothetical protein Moror_17139 [Moniliophthora roreri MCA 2997]|uniref:Uncharacterized protein n=1 Tax=Moniliophthora roreri (strain MCA 2997) TaxID=1381753 RepID=V2WPK6_MONRO|nr:hypothetical protein Moror_17139 [Moniliophthora roreri MCA 2997]